ncbi:aspartate carbamoyltransferase catalytic subunit [Aquiluna sp. Uisw_065]|uniref:aspartate carbamoyltransferase catalytic subunit n=1 Tax=Aquiluna sp. Uisw_065 TaxID=3230967 RepID=UPI0039E7FDA1
MKHLISARDLTKDSAVALLDSAQQLSQVNQRTVKSLPALRGKTVVNLFYENSTRTRISFEIAAKRLSADVINFDAQASSTSKGESLKDTAQTLEALGAAAIIIRHPMSGAAHALANRGWVSASIINAGDGRHEHPTQALLDALTIRQLKFSGSDLTGVKVLIVGDLEHSRVARSNILLLSLLGAAVSVAGPAELVPEGIAAMGATVYKSFDEALAEQPDVVMMLRVQLERMQENEAFTTRDYIKNWSLDQTRLTQLGKETVIMHPGPMNRGLEISNQAANDPRSAVLRQVENGLAVRMAVLHRVLSGELTN